LNLNQKLAVLLMPKPQAKWINLRKIKLLFRIYSNLSPRKADSAQNPQRNKPKKLAPQKQPNFTSNFASRTPFSRPCYCIDILRVKVVFADLAGLGIVFRRSG